MTTGRTPRTTVFVSYSHSDRAWLERLNVQLKPLEREGRIQVWDDTKIRAGARLRDEIRGALESARVAVLLVSADFLASEFITENELPPLLRAAKRDGATILPVIVSPCLYTAIPELHEFQAVNDPNRPLVGLKRGARDMVFLSVARQIMACLNDPHAVAAPELSPTSWLDAPRDTSADGLRVWGEVDEAAIRRIRPFEVMASTGHSVLRKCVLDDELCVVKVTRAALCELEALRAVVPGERGPFPGGLT